DHEVCGNADGRGDRGADRTGAPAGPWGVRGVAGGAGGDVPVGVPGQAVRARLLDPVGAVVAERRVADAGVPGELGQRPVRGALQGHRRGGLGGLAVHARPRRDRHRAAARHRDARRRHLRGAAVRADVDGRAPAGEQPGPGRPHRRGAGRDRRGRGPRRGHRRPGPLVEAPAGRPRPPLAGL
ncbi:MAG: putative integral membrane protein SCJ12.13c, partial [uncultured Corynebacteriales bacterium]